MPESLTEKMDRKRREIERAARAKVALGLRWVNDNPIAKAAALEAAGQMGVRAGVLRGAYHAGKGFVDTGVLAARAIQYPEVRDAIRDRVIQTGRAVGDYVGSRTAQPQRLAQDVQSAARDVRRHLDPNATPKEANLSDEFRRRFDIGLNQGEAGFDIGSMVVGGPGAKAVGRAATAVRATPMEAYLAQGIPPKVAAYFAEPYKGMGSHYMPRRWENLPKGYMDSEFNVLQPEGITRGDMYRLHYEVDPRYYGGNLPRGLEQKGWSGAKLGWKTRGPIGRALYGAPGALKARLGGGFTTTGGMLEDLTTEGDQ